MDENKQESIPQKVTNKKLLENPFVSSLVVPIAIVLFGALIIFGVTKMLSTERSYKDLVNELHSKAFGNRWVAAYELSKVLNTKSVPEQDIPWLVEELSSVYDNAADPRTRQFIVVALGAIKDPAILPALERAMDDEDKSVKFRALVSVGNYPSPVKFNWQKVIKLTQDEDHAIQHSAIFTLATHKVNEANDEIAKLLNSDRLGVKYAAATALIQYHDARALEVIREILFTDTSKNQNVFDENQIINLKLNVLQSLEKNPWNALSKDLQKLSLEENKTNITTKAKAILNLLKN